MIGQATQCPTEPDDMDKMPPAPTSHAYQDDVEILCAIPTYSCWADHLEAQRVPYSAVPGEPAWPVYTLGVVHSNHWFKINMWQTHLACDTKLSHQPPKPVTPRPATTST